MLGIEASFLFLSKLILTFFLTPTESKLIQLWEAALSSLPLNMEILTNSTGPTNQFSGNTILETTVGWGVNNT